VTPAEERRALQRIDRGILDLRIALALGDATGERREALVDELEALRLARVGVHAPGQRDYLRRCGVTAGGRRPRLQRGPWPGHPVRVIA
jgi:chloramphenicol 3-O-phosphotransferase